ncbi:(2Fe-2S)-binding protein [Gemmatimonas sp.]|uniref:(2Fe-2S)-binding protein n=1 Tax=Gemmatimonas sp. TaxID=1962908 RepID=UPI003983CA24
MMNPISLLVNGTSATVTVDADTPLLWVLRQSLGLPGTKFGCGMAVCGACMVHIDGAPVPSCVTPVSAASGKAITTIEGISGPVAEAVQGSWAALDVPQCGYCQSGQVMSAVALLQANASPSDADIDRAMQANLCRCGTYPRIRAAIHRAADTLPKTLQGST